MEKECWNFSDVNIDIVIEYTILIEDSTFSTRRRASPDGRAQYLVRDN